MNAAGVADSLMMTVLTCMHDDNEDGDDDGDDDDDDDDAT